MKTIKAIVFGALILTATVSAFWLMCCMCAVEVNDMMAFLKSFVLSAIALGGSVLAIKHLYERWYK